MKIYNQIQIFYLITIVVLSMLACKTDKKKTEIINVQTETVPKEKETVKTNSYNYKNELTENNLIDIEKELKLEFGDYIMNYKDSILSFCNFETLYNPLDSYDDMYISICLEGYFTDTNKSNDEKVVKYSKGNSFIEVCEWRNEQTDENEIYLGKGLLIDKEIEFPNGAKIGMNKKDFLSRFFVVSEQMLSEIKQVSVCQDERGELYTKYKFKNHKLIEIESGNQNENSFELLSEKFVNDKNIENQSIYPLNYSESPTVIIQFADFHLVIDKFDVWEKGKLTKIHKDTAKVHISLDNFIQGRKIRIVQDKFDVIEVYQRMENSISISDEGAHCDLKDWKHYYSDWEKIPILNNEFNVNDYDENEYSKFISVSVDELKEVVKIKCGDKFYKNIEKIKNATDYPSIVVLSRIYLKIILQERENGKKQTKNSFV